MKSIVALLTLACAIGCATLSTTQPTDAGALLRPLAHEAKSGLAPTLTRPLKEAAFDDVRIVGDTLLAKTMVEAAVAEDQTTPRCDRFVAMDLAGNERWSMRRAGCADSIVATTSSGVWYDDGAGALRLLSLADGASIASLSLQKGAAVRAWKGTIWIAGVSGNALLVVDESTGKPVRSAIAFDAPVGTYRLWVGDDAIFAAVGSTMLVVDASSGEVASTLASFPALAAGVRPRRVNGVIVAATSSHALVAWNDGGEKIWKLAMGTDRLVWADDRPLLLGASLRAIDVVTGNATFTTALPAKSTGAFATNTKTYFTTTATELVAIDASSGKVRFATEIPERFPIGRAADDVLLSSDGSTLALVDGGRFAGFDVRDGSVRWSMQVDGVEALLPSARAAAVDDARTKTGLPAYEDSEMLQAGVRARFDQIQLASTTEDDPSFTFGEEPWSMDAATGARTESVMPEVFDMMRRIASVVRAEERLRVAIDASRTANQGDFVVRAVRGLGVEGVIVVRISDGTFAEVATGPSETWLDEHLLASSIAFSPSTRTLVAVGPGLDVDRWRVVPRGRFLRLLARSLLVFHLDDDAFHPISEHARRSILS